MNVRTDTTKNRHDETDVGFFPTTNETTRGGSYFVAGAVYLAALVLPLSFTGGAVATSAIARDIGGSPAALGWITNAFMLSFGSLLMTAGMLADTYGRKRVFTLGVALFVLVSFGLCAISELVWLDILRAVQGVGAAAAMAGGAAALAQEFEGKARAHAFSLLGTTFGVGLAFGPVVAGMLANHYGWRAIFLSSAFIGTVALVTGIPRMRESRDPNATGLDWMGGITFTGMLALLTWAIMQAPQSGWSDPAVIGPMTGAAVLLAFFIALELRIDRPMLDLSLFRYPRFVGVQVLPIATCYCFVVLLVLLPMQFIGIDGYGEIKAGLMMVALSAPLLVVPSLATLLSRWLPAALLCSVGLLIAAAGLMLLSHVVSQHDLWAVVASMLVIGLGTGLPWGLMDGLSISVVPTERAGMATGIFSTTRVAGEGLGIAIVGAVLATLIQHHLAGASGGMPHVATAAPALAVGDMAKALDLLPRTSPTTLMIAYMEAFRTLLHTLAAITMAAAIAVALLKPSHAPKHS
jgi:MFS family permease